LAIHSTIATASCANQGMYFINKHDDFTLCVSYLFNNSLQTLFKLTLVFGTCNQQAHI
jgi:hypothetical protein